MTRSFFYIPPCLSRSFFAYLCGLCLLFLYVPVAEAAPKKQAGPRLETVHQAAQGDAFSVLVWSPSPVAEVVVQWGEKKFSTSMHKSGPQGHRAVFLLGVGGKGVPGPRDLIVTLRSAVGTQKLRRSIEIRQKVFEEQHLTVKKSMVNLSKEDLARHSKEKKQVRAATGTSAPERFWTSPFVRPVPGTVSSTYGLTRFFNGQPRSPHSGLDLRGKTGTPIKAITSGEVVLTGNHFFSGNCVYIDHGQGVVSMYAHMSEIVATQGQFVSAGEVIGKVGATGRVTGPHLHFSVKILGTYVDPLPLIEGKVLLRD